MIVYALIGMPVNMILYAYLGEYFATRVSFGLNHIRIQLFNHSLSMKGK